MNPFKLRQAALMCLIAAAFLSGCTRQPKYPAPPVQGNEVVIDISSLPLEVPQFYTFRNGRSAVSFFVVRLEGGVQSFFDACGSCYAQKRGYAFADGRLVCRNCGTGYSIHKLKGIGGCYPLQLEGRTRKGTYRISTAALLAQAAKFRFK